MSPLADCEKKFLLEVARRAVIAAVEQRHLEKDGVSASGFAVSVESNSERPQTLEAPAGAFVTLRSGSRLRGCIGQLAGHDSLVHVVTYCAKAAALDDPRFSPLTREELVGIDIEISVLSPLEDMAPQNIICGRHGLLVSRHGNRGVLLPQVATQFNWTPDRFLEEACIKAGLNRSAWKDPQTRIKAFTAEVFSESELTARELPKPGYSIST
jgi:uncharacterized protein